MNQEIKSKVEELVLENLESLGGDRSYGSDKDKARNACLTETLKLMSVLEDSEVHQSEAIDREAKRSLEEKRIEDAKVLEEAKLKDVWRKIIELTKVGVPAVVSVVSLGLWAVRTYQMLILNETGTVHTRTSLENLSFPKIGK